MKINKFEKVNLKVVREAIENALKDVEREFGINLDLGAMRYDDATFTASLKAKVNNSKVLQDAYAFELGLLKLPKNSIGRSFTLKGRTYKINDVSMRAKKYPVTCTRDDGKLIKFPADIIKRELTNN